jgi:hypothetical protein
VKSKESQDSLEGEGWSKGCSFFDEAQAHQEFDWLSSHNEIREYVLVGVTKNLDDLNDDVPF